MSFDYEESLWGKGTASLRFTDPTSIRLKHALRAISGLKSGAKILEMGCGAGQFIRAIKKIRPELQCYGFDISKAAIDLAKQANDGVDYQFDTSGMMPFGNDVFDAVIILDVLEHVENPSGLVEQVRTVLKPGGIFYSFVPCEGDTLSLWNLLRRFGIGKDLTKNFAGHIQYFSRKQVNEVFSKSGFQIVRKDYSEHVLGQVVGVLAFFGMKRYSARKGEQINNEEFFKESGLKNLGFLKKLVNGLIYLESHLLFFIPSPNVHTLAKKQQQF